MHIEPGFLITSEQNGIKNSYNFYTAAPYSLKTLTAVTVAPSSYLSFFPLPYLFYFRIDSLVSTISLMGDRSFARQIWF
jgi:hypothetical protein